MKVGLGPKVTAILLSWKRKPNMPLIVQAIRQQTVETEIWVINNNGTESFGADRVICAHDNDGMMQQPWNMGEWARYVFAPRITTEYGMFQDDDFVLGDDIFLEDAITIHREKCPKHLLGVAGRGFRPNPPHYAPDIIHTDAYAAILKGHFQLWRRGCLLPLHVPSHPSASDIYWSLDLSRGKPKHWVSKMLSRRLITLERFGVGYEYRQDHYKERNDVCAQYKKDYGVNV